MSWMDSRSAGPDRSWVSVPNRSLRPGITLSLMPAKNTTSTTTTAVSTFAQPGMRLDTRLMGVVMRRPSFLTARMPGHDPQKHGGTVLLADWNTAGTLGGALTWGTPRTACLETRMSTDSTSRTLRPMHRIPLPESGPPRLTTLATG